MIIKTSDDNYFKWCKNLRSNGKKIVFINGCFDIIHLGHLEMIKFAKSLYSNYELVIALNSDMSIRLQNKNHKLIFNQEYRADYLSHFVDNIVLFDEITPSQILWNIMPDTIVKGIEYKDKMFPEKFIADKIGAKLYYYDSYIDMSTTKIIDMIRGMNNEGNPQIQEYRH